MRLYKEKNLYYYRNRSNLILNPRKILNAEIQGHKLNDKFFEKNLFKKE